MAGAARPGRRAATFVQVGRGDWLFPKLVEADVPSRARGGDEEVGTSARLCGGRRVAVRSSRAGCSPRLQLQNYKESRHTPHSYRRRGGGNQPVQPDQLNQLEPRRRINKNQPHPKY